jgi:hypothetical protein
MPYSQLQAKTTHESVVALGVSFEGMRREFNEHVAQEDRRFASIEGMLQHVPTIELSLAKIEGGQDAQTKVLDLLMSHLKGDVAGLKEDLKSLEKRFVTIEHWRWGIIGAVPILTVLSLYVLKHVFNITL